MEQIIHKDTNLSSNNQFRGALEKALKATVNVRTNQLIAGSWIQKIIAHFYFAEEKSNGVQDIAVTKDYVVLYNLDWVEGQTPRELAFALVHLAFHITQDHANRWRSHDLRYWDKAVDAEINTAICSAYKMFAPKSSSFFYHKMHSRNTYVSKRVNNAKKVSIQKGDEYYGEANLPGSHGIHNLLPARGTYNTAEYMYRTMASNNTVHNLTMHPVSNWDTHLDAVSPKYAIKTAALKDFNGCPEVHVTPSEHQQILTEFLKGTLKSQTDFGHALCPISPDTDNNNPLSIDWEKIIKDIEAIASGNKEGGQHDYAMFPANKRENDDFMMPSMVGGKSSKICIIIDNSGSVDELDLMAARDQVEIILDLGIPSVDVIYCDTVGVMYPDITALSDLPFTRGGGTNMINGLELAFSQPKTYDMVVIISDGDTAYPALDDFPANRYMFVIVENNCTDTSYIPDHVPYRLVHSRINPSNPRIN